MKNQTEPNKAEKSTQTTKTGKKPATKKKAANVPPKPRKPRFLLPYPTMYACATAPYTELIKAYNELKGTKHNVWRVSPAIFLGIHKEMLAHYKTLENGK
jgi:hypothetical protein